MFVVKDLLRCAALVSMLGSTGALYAQDKLTVQSENKRIEHPTGEKAADLREYGFWERKTRLGPTGSAADDAIYNSTIYAWYETKSIKDVESYTFVRYIKGCAFVSMMTPGGIIKQGLAVTRQHLGERIVFVHPEWEIDSDGKGPTPGNAANAPLLPHYSMEWGAPKGVFPDKSYHAYGEDPPLLPRLYFTARPSIPAYLERDGDSITAFNHSFESKVCLYRTKDIPTSIEKGQFIEHPLDCFSWSSSYIYDHAARKFASQPAIAPICRPETIPSPEKKWEFME